ncbi:Arm DNA-binding domain-containing protein [Nocardia sp. NBC_01499]|uniref:Arm DNA-binding domain-containing protein n=1 Tax=Nocardia sp. NBC_01499 TaxID=2903597 RepID=UPI00386FC99B
MARPAAATGGSSCGEADGHQPIGWLPSRACGRAALQATGPSITKGGFKTEKEAWTAARDAIAETERGPAVCSFVDFPDSCTDPVTLPR